MRLSRSDRDSRLETRYVDEPVFSFFRSTQAWFAFLAFVSALGSILGFVFDRESVGLLLLVLCVYALGTLVVSYVMTRTQ